MANDAMLAEVKKEVDIMVRSVTRIETVQTLTSHLQRVLRGHPNIVYLIDAAWNRMPNGMYEAFVLMEFCQGPPNIATFLAF